MKFKPGDEVTAVYYNLGTRYVHLLKITKVGRKYIYGTTIWVDPDGTTRDGHPTKVNLEESVIYRGLRHDLDAAEDQYRKDYQQWQQQKKSQRQDFEWELKTLVQDKVDAWEVDNPMPHPPEFPAPGGPLDGY